LAATAKALSPLIFSKDPKDRPLIETLCDIGRMNADGFFENNSIRRKLLIYSVNSEWRTTLAETKPGEFIFGSDLEDRLTKFKALLKSAQELKPKQPTSVPKNVSGPPTRQLPQKAGQGGQKQIPRRPTTQPRYNQQKPRTYKSNPQKRSSSHSRYNSRYDSKRTQSNRR